MYHWLSKSAVPDVLGMPSLVWLLSVYKYIIALNNNCSYFGLICLCFNINEIEIYDETSTEAKLFNIDCIKPLDQFVVYSSEAVYRCSIRAKCNTTKMEFCNLDITVVAASDRSLCKLELSPLILIPWQIHINNALINCLNIFQNFIAAKSSFHLTCPKREQKTQTIEISEHITLKTDSLARKQ